MYSRFGNMDSRTRVGSYFDPRTGNPQTMSEPAFNMSGANTPASGQALNAPRGREDIGYVPQQQNTEATLDMSRQKPMRYQGLEGVPDWAAPLSPMEQLVQQGGGTILAKDGYQYYRDGSGNYQLSTAFPKKMSGAMQDGPQNPFDQRQASSRYVDSDFVVNKADDALRRTMTGYSPEDMLGMYDRGKQGEINPEYIQHFKANSGLDRVDKEMGAFRQLQQANEMLQGNRSYDAPRYGQPENRRPVNAGVPSTETLIRGADIISGNSPNVSPEQIAQLQAIAGFGNPADVPDAERNLRMSQVRLRNAANRRTNSGIDYRILDEMNRREGIG